LKRSTDSGSHWTTVRQVAYNYYDGSQAHGNLGDLMTATVVDGAGNPTNNAIDTCYYRYYTPAEIAAHAPGYVGGLKFVFTADSYGRLVGAGLSSDLDTLGDDQVKAYANNYFEYDASLRVSKEVAQGAGCSACAGGLGTFTFAYTNVTPTPTDYNAWATKTVETLPDGNQNIVYTNAYGEVMLSVYHDTTGQQNSWYTYYKFDGQGRCIMMAAPSAVSGIDPTHPDLGVSFQPDANAGLITLYDYYQTGDPTPALWPAIRRT
jgi:hypothetical protein